MAYTKPHITNDSVIRLLNKVLDSPISNLSSIDSGQIASTYSFDMADKKLFVQFNYENMSQGYRTEVFYAERFSLNDVPVRKIIAQGEYEGFQYSISEKAIGESLDKINANDFELAFPSVMDCLVKIESVDLEGTVGYGWLDNKFNGAFSSWPDHLMQIKDEEPGYFYGEWHHLFKTTFLDKNIFDKYLGRLERLLPKLPDERYLVHGGFGYGNVLVHDHNVSAVLDWQDARYGDPLFDLAYMVFWRNDSVAAKCLDVYQSSISKSTISMENFNARMACYKYYIGLDSMRFSAKTNNHSFYKYVLGILESI